MATPLSQAQIQDKLKNVPEGGDRDLYDKLFEVRRDASGKVTSANPPMFMTPDEILRTHGMIGEYAGENLMNASRADIIHKKYNESFDKDYSTLSGEKKTFNPGVGTGSGVADSIEEHGYNWKKPIPLGIHGLHAEGYGTEHYPEPMVANGQHRLAYMWMHHPDTMIPVHTQMEQDIHDPMELGHAHNYIAGRVSTELTKKRLGEL